MNKNAGLLVLVVLQLSLLPEGRAEPLPLPSWSELCGARQVVEASYVSYRAASAKGVSYFDPPVAVFKTLRQIRGTGAAESLEIRYDFQDGSACLEPQGWKFSEKLLPSKASRWILFVTRESKGVFQTYRGDLGRVPAGSLGSFILQECSKIWNQK